jgi:hypothetical protein
VISRAFKADFDQTIKDFRLISREIEEWGRFAGHRLSGPRFRAGRRKTIRLRMPPFIGWVYGKE